MSSPKEAVLFYYFDYTDQANQMLEKVAACLLRQMLCAANYVPKDIQNVHDDCAKRSGNPDFALLSLLLDSCSKRFCTIHLIFDALDEFQQSRLKKLISFLSHLKDAKEPCFKILCTTRPHLSDLANELNALATFEIESCNPDVANYINWRLEEEWQHHEDLKPIVLKAIIGQKDVE